MVLRGAILRSTFGAKSFGKLLGTVMGSGSLGGILGPTLAGWAYDSFGTYHLVWLFLFGATLLATPLIFKIR